MHEIKFRGKELETNKWVNGYLLGNENEADNFVYIAPFDITPPLEIKDIIIKGGYPNFSAEDYSRCWRKRECVSIPVIRVDKETIGQYTNLKDKNGEEIYEGDIIKIDDDYELYGFYAGELYQVYFAFSSFRLKPKYQSENKGACIDDAVGMTIVGNIYDNSELLKGE